MDFSRNKSLNFATSALLLTFILSLGACSDSVLCDDECKNEQKTQQVSDDSENENDSLDKDEESTTLATDSFKFKINSTLDTEKYNPYSILFEEGALEEGSKKSLTMHMDLVSIMKDQTAEQAAEYQRKNENPVEVSFYVEVESDDELLTGLNFEAEDSIVVVKSYKGYDRLKVTVKDEDNQGHRFLLEAKRKTSTTLSDAKKNAWSGTLKYRVGSKDLPFATFKGFATR